MSARVGLCIACIALFVFVTGAGCSPSAERFKGSQRLVSLEDQPPPNVFQSYAPARAGRPRTPAEAAALEREILALGAARERTIDDAERKALEHRMASLRRLADSAGARAERRIEAGAAAF